MEKEEESLLKEKLKSLKKDLARKQKKINKIRAREHVKKKIEEHNSELTEADSSNGSRDSGKPKATGKSSTHVSFDLVGQTRGGDVLPKKQSDIVSRTKNAPERPVENLTTENTLTPLLEQGYDAGCSQDEFKNLQPTDEPNGTAATATAGSDVNENITKQLARNNSKVQKKHITKKRRLLSTSPELEAHAQKASEFRDSSITSSLQCTAMTNRDGGVTTNTTLPPAAVSRQGKDNLPGQETDSKEAVCGEVLKTTASSRKRARRSAPILDFSFLDEAGSGDMYSHIKTRRRHSMMPQPSSSQLFILSGQSHSTSDSSTLSSQRMESEQQSMPKLSEGLSQWVPPTQHEETFHNVVAGTGTTATSQGGRSKRQSVPATQRGRGKVVRKSVQSKPRHNEGLSQCVPPTQFEDSIHDVMTSTGTQETSPLEVSNNQSVETTRKAKGKRMNKATTPRSSRSITTLESPSSSQVEFRPVQRKIKTSSRTSKKLREKGKTDDSVSDSSTDSPLIRSWPGKSVIRQGTSWTPSSAPPSPSISKRGCQSEPRQLTTRLSRKDIARSGRNSNKRSCVNRKAQSIIELPPAEIFRRVQHFALPDAEYATLKLAKIKTMHASPSSSIPLPKSAQRLSGKLSDELAHSPESRLKEALVRRGNSRAKARNSPSTIKLSPILREGSQSEEMASHEVFSCSPDLAALSQLNVAILDVSSVDAQVEEGLDPCPDDAAASRGSGELHSSLRDTGTASQTLTSQSETVTASQTLTSQRETAVGASGPNPVISEIDLRRSKDTRAPHIGGKSLPDPGDPPGEAPVTTKMVLNKDSSNTKPCTEDMVHCYAAHADLESTNRSQLHADVGGPSRKTARNCPPESVHPDENYARKEEVWVNEPELMDTLQLTGDSHQKAVAMDSAYLTSGDGLDMAVAVATVSQLYLCRCPDGCKWRCVETWSMAHMHNIQSIRILTSEDIIEIGVLTRMSGCCTIFLASHDTSGRSSFKKLQDISSPDETRVLFCDAQGAILVAEVSECQSRVIKHHRPERQRRVARGSGWSVTTIGVVSAHLVTLLSLQALPRAALATSRTTAYIWNHHDATLLVQIPLPTEVNLVLSAVAEYGLVFMWACLEGDVPHLVVINPSSTKAVIAASLEDTLPQGTGSLSHFCITEDHVVATTAPDQLSLWSAPAGNYVSSYSLSQTPDCFNLLSNNHLPPTLFTVSNDKLSMYQLPLHRTLVS